MSRHMNQIYFEWYELDVISLWEAYTSNIVKQYLVVTLLREKRGCNPDCMYVKLKFLTKH